MYKVKYCFSRAIYNIVIIVIVVNKLFFILIAAGFVLLLVAWEIENQALHACVSPPPTEPVLGR